MNYVFIGSPRHSDVLGAQVWRRCERYQHELTGGHNQGHHGSLYEGPPRRNSRYLLLTRYTRIFKGLWTLLIAFHWTTENHLRNYHPSHYDSMQLAYLYPFKYWIIPEFPWQEHITSLTGLLARDKVKPRKVAVPMAVAIPFYSTLKSSWRLNLLIQEFLCQFLMLISTCGFWLLMISTCGFWLLMIWEKPFLPMSSKKVKKNIYMYFLFKVVSWILIVILRIFHMCELFARILRSLWRIRTNSSDFERICHTRVTYTFHTSFIGSMNANSSHCSKYP